MALLVESDHEVSKENPEKKGRFSMLHSVPLITTLAAALGLALVMGFLAARLKLPASMTATKYSKRCKFMPSHTPSAMAFFHQFY